MGRRIQCDDTITRIDKAAEGLVKSGGYSVPLGSEEPGEVTLTLSWISERKLGCGDIPSLRLYFEPLPL